MNVPKCVQDFAVANNLQIVEISYHSQGIKHKRKGYDLIDSERRIFASFEPRYLAYVKWYLRNGNTKSGIRIFCRITKEVLKNLIWDKVPTKLQ